MTDENTTSGIYAGAWIRSLALTADVVLMIAVCTIVFLIPNTSFFWENIIYQIVCASYFTFFTASKYQATPGQRLFKIKIADIEEQALSIGNALLRYIVCFAPFWPLVYIVSLPKVTNFIDTFYAIDPNDYEALQSFLLSPETMSVMSLLDIPLILMTVGSLIWYIPMLFTKEKTGLHDIACKQRAYKIITPQET